MKSTKKGAEAIWEKKADEYEKAGRSVRRYHSDEPVTGGADGGSGEPVPDNHACMAGIDPWSLKLDQDSQEVWEEIVNGTAEEDDDAGSDGETPEFTGATDEDIAWAFEKPDVEEGVGTPQERVTLSYEEVKRIVEWVRERGSACYWDEIAIESDQPDFKVWLEIKRFLRHLSGDESEGQ